MYALQLYIIFDGPVGLVSGGVPNGSDRDHWFDSYPRQILWDEQVLDISIVVLFEVLLGFGWTWFEPNSCSLDVL